jgi:hypothetical protein
MQMIWRIINHTIIALIPYAILIVKIIYTNHIVPMEWLVHQQRVILEDETGYNSTFEKSGAKFLF